ncbi:MAG: CoA transferase, partial [Acidimicrobiia bacterium]|nr:CoA transferase [Acidimicrobiia bacterium]
MLDLTDERGQLAGMILAQLAADVIAVEPPGGTGSRRIGPFHHDVEDPELSLVHWAWNRGKRSVVLDLADEADRTRFRELAAGADVLLESYGPGHLAGLGLGPDELQALNPGLVQVSISAFGATGPKAGWAASDLTVAAASGHMALTGDPERAPLRISLPPQAWLQAAGEAAGAALLALTERRRSGLGQHIDVPAQLAMMASTQGYMLATLYDATPVKRAGG